MTTKKILQSRLSQDLLKIFISFILISGGGSILTHLWQKDEFLFQTKIEHQKYEMEYATTLFEDISKQMERQLSNYKLFLVDSSVKQKCQENSHAWNENSTRFRALTKKYFGDSASNSFNYIDGQIKEIADSINEPVSNSNLGTLINNLESDIYKFNEQLISGLLSENIGSSIK
jgi:hypothetical protein